MFWVFSSHDIGLSLAEMKTQMQRAYSHVAAIVFYYFIYYFEKDYFLLVFLFSPLKQQCCYCWLYTCVLIKSS